jgi:hypothetical protein
MFPKLDNMSWIGALKFWNKEKGPIVTDTANVYMLPRKGTEEYKEVRAVQQGEEIPSKKKEREERNKATMDKALGQLRQVESETKARNVERKKEVARMKAPKRREYDETEGDKQDRAVARFKNEMIAYLYGNDDYTEQEALKKFDMFFPRAINRVFMGEAPMGYVQDILDDFAIEYKDELRKVLESRSRKKKKSVEMDIAKMELTGDDMDRIMGDVKKDVDEAIKNRQQRTLARVNSMMTGKGVEGKSDAELKTIVRRWAKENKRSLKGINNVSRAGLLKFIEEKNIPV